MPRTSPKKVIVAYRALRHADPKGLLVRANALAESKFPSVRREVAVSLKGASFFGCRKALIGLIEGYDGRNRYYLEALGVAFHGKEREVYEQLVPPPLSEARSMAMEGQEFGLAPAYSGIDP